MAGSEKYFTVAEAADLCGVSADTIRRRRDKNAFPGAHQKTGDPNGTWQIPLADLVTAGLYSEAQATSDDATEQLGRTRVERKLLEAREEIIRANALIDALRETVKRQDDQVKYLRSLVSTMSSQAAA